MTQQSSLEHSPFGATKDELVSLMQSRSSDQLHSKWGGLGGLASALCTDLVNGLSTENNNSTLAIRKAHFGVNEIPEPAPRPLIRHILDAVDATLILLIVAALLSLVFGLAFFPPEQLEWLDSIGIGFAVVIVIVVTAGNNWSKDRKFRQLSAVEKDHMVRAVKTDNIETPVGRPVMISVKDVVVGDVIHLEAGDAVPADGVLIFSSAASDGIIGADGTGISSVANEMAVHVKVDESSLTGESDNVHCNASNPFLLSGTRIVDGVCTMLVLAVGESTEWGRTMATVSAQEAEETPLQKKLGMLARYIGIVGITVAVLNFIALTIKYFAMTLLIEGGEEFSVGTMLDNLLNYAIVAITIVVVAVPEGLPLAVTISLAYSMKKMLRDNNLVRHLAACETMGSATTICSDKTGTLTTNVMEVTEGWFGGSHFDRVPAEEELHQDVFNVICDGIAINSTAHVGTQAHPSSPTSTKELLTTEFIGNKTECSLLYMLVRHYNIDYAAIRRDAIPDIAMVCTFNSDRKRMSTVVRLPDDDTENGDIHVGDGHIGGLGSHQSGQFRIFIKGAAEVVLERCTKAMSNINGEIVALDDDTRRDLQGHIDDMSSRGLRTICIAFNDFQIVPPEQSFDDSEGEPNGTTPPSMLDPENPPENDLIVVAIVGIKDPLRPEVRNAVDQCNRAGITVRMVTGDNLLTAQHIARECGILPDDGMDDKELGRVMEGDDFRSLTDEELMEVLPRLLVLARSRPTDKHRLVTLLKSMGEVVAVTGDGTNDAPALKAAHVGLSMGLCGTEVAKEASDVVILDDNFSSIVKSVLWGRSVFENIRKFLQFQLTINLVALCVTFIGSLVGAGFPLTAVQLLFVNLIMDTFAALALASEPPSDDLLEQPPHGTGASLITNDMWKCISIQSIFQLVVCFALIYGHEFIFGPIGADNPWSRKSSPGDYTLIFNVFVMMQLFNEVNCRKIRNEFNILQGITKSPLFIAILVCTVIMQVIIVEIGRFIGPQYMGTSGLTLLEWCFSIAVGSLSIPIGYICRLIPVPQRSLMNLLRGGNKDKVTVRQEGTDVELLERQLHSNQIEDLEGHVHRPGSQGFIRLVEEGDRDPVLDVKHSG